MAQSKVEKELIKATGVKKKGKKRQEFLAALVVGFDGLENADSVYEELSPETQEWINKATTAHGKDKPIPDYDVEEKPEEEEESEEKPAKKSRTKTNSKRKTRKAADEDEDESEESEEEDEPAPRKKKRTKRKARDADGDEDEESGSRKKKKKGARKSRPKGGRAHIKEMVIDNPDITTDQCIKELEAKGIELTKSAVSSIRSGMVDSLKICAEKKILSADYMKKNF